MKWPYNWFPGLSFGAFCIMFQAWLVRADLWANVGLKMTENGQNLNYICCFLAWLLWSLLLAIRSEARVASEGAGRYRAGSEGPAAQVPYVVRERERMTRSRRDETKRPAAPSPQGWGTAGF